MHRFQLVHFDKNDQHIIEYDQAVCNHMKALRLRVGEACELVDLAQEMVYVGIYDGTGFSIVSSRNMVMQFVEIDLFQSIPKGQKAEWIVQKSVEIGISNIFFVPSRRCVAKWSPEQSSKKCERLQKIAEEASLQSKSEEKTKVLPFLSWAEALMYMKQGTYDAIFVCYEQEQALSLKQAMAQYSPNGAYRFAVVIGPEGGFEQEEVAQVPKKTVIHLGRRILRTETAAIVAVAQMNFYFNR